MAQAIGVPFLVYALAILLVSPSSNPAPFSHAAAERYEAYVIWCLWMDKTPSQMQLDYQRTRRGRPHIEWR